METTRVSRDSKENASAIPTIALDYLYLYLITPHPSSKSSAVGIMGVAFIKALLRMHDGRCYLCLAWVAQMLLYSSSHIHH
jgi:hypothetical protein